jgi:hypothetical protein
MIIDVQEHYLPTPVLAGSDAPHEFWHPTGSWQPALAYGSLRAHRGGSAAKFPVLFVQPVP